MHPILKDKAVLIDMDGVLYRGDERIAGAAEFIAALRRNKNSFVFLTNNSQFTAKQLVEFLARMGILAHQDEIFTSAIATAALIKAKIREAGTAYVIGGFGTHKAFQEVGWKTTSEEPFYSAQNLLDPTKIDAVVIAEGYQLTAARMEQASNLVAAGIPFYATNPDPVIPGPQGSLMVACGSLYAGIEVATGKRAIVVGKPEIDFFRQALERLGSSSQNTVMVGDRLETDILGAKRCGLQAVVVLSGAASASEAKQYEPKPDLIVPSVAELLTNEEVKG